MGKVIEAVYEQGVFRPREPIALPEGQAVQVVLPEAGLPARGPRDERLRRHFGAWRSGDPNSADNERIDADLARAYGSSHEPEA
jgi:predicted DNA-binding antitoxin AbrB/MazE fold protein